MGKQETDKVHNLKNLRDVTSHMNDIDYFLFFGTLLGYCRDGDIIQGDDDVDLLVDRKYYNESIDILKRLGFNVNTSVWNKNYDGMVQGTRMVDGHLTHFDFYFYEDNSDDYIIEKWNFFANPESSNSHLHIPKEIVYPIKTVDMKDFKCKVPSNVEECCKFLYGDRYMTPMIMKEQYMVEKLVNNIPYVVYYD